ncbi:hypothetical protein MKW92_027450, partial [Papaver armeniacum]
MESSHEITQETSVNHSPIVEAEETIETEEIIDDHSLVEEVRLVVPETDDPSLPVMTFRVWVL